MSENENQVRHSEAENASLLTDPEHIARKESQNSVRQAERVKEIVLSALYGDRPFRLRPSLLLDLNRCAIDGLSAYAGNWRPASVAIKGSKHQPPGGHMVPSLIEEMCDFVNDNWACLPATRLSAFLLWRINWIHPFTDGNGRTARAVSHAVLCIRSGSFFPGDNTIPVQILRSRGRYYAALESANASFDSLGLAPENVDELEEMIASMLAVQLKEAFETATTKPADI